MKPSKLFQTPTKTIYNIQNIQYIKYAQEHLYSIRPETHLDYLVCESNKYTQISLIHQVKIATNRSCIHIFKLSLRMDFSSMELPIHFESIHSFRL